jgi:hypothetical protein
MHPLIADQYVPFFFTAIGSLHSLAGHFSVNIKPNDTDRSYTHRA